MTNKKHSILTIGATLIVEKDLSWLVKLDSNDEEVWVPKSECEFSDGELQIPEWLALKIGAI